MFRFILVIVAILICHSVAGAETYSSVKTIESYEASEEWIKPVTKILCDRYCVSPTVMVINYNGKEEWFWTSHKGMIDNLKLNNVTWIITTDEYRQVTSMIHDTYLEEKRLHELVSTSIDTHDYDILKELERY